MPVRIRQAVRRIALVGSVLALVVAAGAMALRAADQTTASQESVHRVDRLQLAGSLGTLAAGYFEELSISQGNVASALVPALAKSPAGLVAALDSGLSTLPGGPAALLIGPTGAVLAGSSSSTALVPALQSVSGGLSADLSARRPAISREVLISGHPSLIIEVPEGPSGDLLAVSYRLDYLPIAAYVQQLRIGTAAVPYVVDAAGRLLTSPNIRQVGQVAPSAVLHAIDQAKGTEVVQIPAATPEVVAVVPVGIAGWHLVIIQPAPVFYGALWQADTTMRWALLGLLVVIAAALLMLHSRRQSALHEVAGMAVRDALTNLPNRLAFAQALERAVERHRRDGGAVALLFCDLDGFKAVNDRLGHDAGDALLVAAASRLADVVAAHSDGGATIARLGGDEFTVLLEGRHAHKEASAISVGLTDSLAQPFVLGAQEVNVGVSVGVAFAHPDRDLLRDADVAMYRTKAVRRSAREASAPDHLNQATGPTARAI